MKRILFVDDEPHILDALKRTLRGDRNQWHMSFVSSSEDALAVLATSAFDVIVTDMRMPGMDGAALLEHIQQRHPGMARIVLSGHMEVEAALRVAAIAHQFLSKPCEPDKLRRAIERACDCRTMLNDERIRRAVGAIGRLPSLPSTSAELLGALQHDDVDLARVGKTIEQDVGMTAKILQLVNSAFFGLSSEVTNVRTAVNYLGLETLRQLVVSVEIFRTFQPSDVCGFSLVDFEVHSQLAARLARRLPLPQRLASIITVAALLHDAGKLVLASRLPDQFQRALCVAREQRVPLHTVEEEVVGTTHAYVGAHLLNLWGLPNPIVEAAWGHHTPMSPVVPTSELDIVGATHVADALAHEMIDNAAGKGIAGCDLLNLDYLAELGVTRQIPAWRALARREVGICDNDDACIEHATATCGDESLTENRPVQVK